MKRVSLLLSLLLFSYVVGCSSLDAVDDNSTTQTTIIIPVESSNLQLDSEALDQTITFTATEPWAISISELTKSSPDWIEVSPMSGGAGEVTLSIKLAENTTSEDRFASIIIVTDNGKSEINVTQAEFIEKLTLNNSSQSVTCEAGSFAIDVTSNTDWIINNSSSWITLPQTSGSGNQTITVTYTANKTYEERSDSFTIQTEGVTQTFTLTQAGEIFVATLSLSTTNESVAKESGSFTINVISNADWTISNSSSWITLSTTQGSGNQTITVSYTANTSYDDRSDSFSISVAGITQSVTITQASEIFIPTLSLDINNTTVSEEAGSLTLNVSSNTNWNITNSSSWLTLSTIQGSGNRAVTIAYDANASTSERTTSITITTTDYDISNYGSTITITITQSGDLSVTPTDPYINDWGSDDDDDNDLSTSVK